MLYWSLVAEDADGQVGTERLVVAVPVVVLGTVAVTVTYLKMKRRDFEAEK